MPAAEAVPINRQRVAANLDERGRAMTRLRDEAPSHRRIEAPPPFPSPSFMASPRGARQIGCYDRPAAPARSKEGSPAAPVSCRGRAELLMDRSTRRISRDC